MQFKNRPLYLLISSIVIFVVSVVMLSLLVFDYVDSKNKLTSSLERSSKGTIDRLEESIKPFITSYSVNEYEKIIETELSKQSILAIVIEDYVTGELLGETYITGKTRDKQWNIIEYNINENLIEDEHLYYENIVQFKGKKIAKIRLFTSYRFLNEELNQLVIKSLTTIFIISLLLIFFMFFFIRKLILEPINQMIDTILVTDDNGIPINMLQEGNSTEMSLLTRTINTMLNSIRTSKDKLLYEQYRYQQLMLNSTELVFIMDLEGNLIEYSKQTQDVLEYSDEEMKTLTVYYWDDGLTKEEFTQILSFLSTEPIYFERKFVTKTGKELITGIRATYVEIFDQKYIYATARDITQEKQNKEIILQQKEEFESIFKFSKDGISIIDLNANLLEFNDSYMQLIGYSKEELKDKSYLELITSDERKNSKKALSDATTHGFVENYETIYLTKNGGRVRVSMTITLFPDNKRFLIVSRDITSQKIMQEQSKLASMGEMIGNIAHQWRQPLSVISTASTGVLLYKDMGQISDEFLEKEMNQINDNAQYLSKTIDDFRDFIKGDRQEVAFNLSDDINSFLHLVEGSIKANSITLVKELDDQMIINGYPNELIQCLINIFNNAKDALKEFDGDRYIFINSFKAGRKAIIVIKDNAGGIPENVLPHIFEPYFTTKHQSKGTGLGLSMTYNLIVDGMKGSIEAQNVAYSHEGFQHKGAEFTIKLDLV